MPYWSGDGDDSPRTGVHIKVTQIGNAMVADNAVGVDARQADRAGWQQGYDATLTACGGCRQCDDSTAAGSLACAAQKIGQATDAAELATVEVLTVDLAEQIDRKRAVDRGHARDRAQYAMIVGMANLAKAHSLGNGRVKGFGTEGDPGDDGVGIIRQHVGFDQAEQAIGNHAAVDAQITAI